MQPELPTKDQWTTYDYELGARRMQDVREGKYSLVDYYDELIVGDGYGYTFLKIISREKTIEFAMKCIETWGREYAEKVLSASNTGSLYFHVIHHFDSFEKFLEEYAPLPRKRLKVSKE